MAKKSKRISRPVKQKFSPGFFYLVFSLIILILITFFINTSKISKEPKAAEKAFVTPNGVSCARTYTGRKYAFCERSCGGSRLSFKGWVQTAASSTVCGTYTVKPNIYPNYSPWDLKGIMNRPSKTYNAYCCVSSN